MITEDEKKVILQELRDYRRSLEAYLPDLSLSKDRKLKPRKPLFAALDFVNSHFVQLPSYENMITKNRIFVVKERYEDRFFVIEPFNNKKIGEIALKIVKERYDKEYYTDLEVVPEDIPSFSKEQIKSLPIELKKEAESLFIKYESAKEFNLRTQESRILLKEALAGDPLAATQFLSTRLGYEYEEIIMHFESF